MQTNDGSDKEQCKENIKKLEIIIHLLNKDIPVKPILAEEQTVRCVDVYNCPTCGGKFTSMLPSHCYHCGQSFDWEDNETEYGDYCDDYESK